MTSFARIEIAEANRRLARASASLSGDSPRRMILSRLMTRMADDKPLDGFELERCQENANLAGKPFDRQRVVLRWEDLRVGPMTAGTPGAAGYLTSTDTADPVDILPPFLVIARAGCTILANQQNNLSIPVESAIATPIWQLTETTTVADSVPTLAQIALSPHTVGTSVSFSRQLSLQADVENYLRRSLIRTVMTAVDKAALAGDGSAGSPMGLLHTPGIGTQSGTDFTWAGALSMKSKASVANAQNIAFIGTPAVRAVSEGREKASGSGFIWADDRVVGCPAFATTDLPAGALVCGPWERLVLALWGPGIEIEINPYAAFQSGVLSARVFITCDVGILSPGAFVVATTVT